LQPRTGSVPLISSVTGTVIEGTACDATYWGRNLRDPFRFAAVTQRLVDQGYDTFLEISPHPVLARPILQGCHQASCEATVLPSLSRSADERGTLLASLGTLYAMGRAVEWRRLYPVGGRCVALPAYPWQRERYWFDQLDGSHARRLTAQVSRKGASTHPLMGEHVEFALFPEQHVWDLDLDPNSLHYLRDHRVQGAVIMPGSAYLEMGLAAAAQVYEPGSYVVEEVAFRRALVLAAGDVRRVQFVLAPAAPGTATFQIFSRPAGAAGQPDGWQQHVTGTVRYGLGATAATNSPHGGCREIQARCQEQIAGAQHYQTMAEHGLHYGATFQVVEWIWRRDGEALAELRLPGALEPGVAVYQVHPVLLDAGFQVMAATLPVSTESAARAAMYLPAGVERVQVFGRPGRHLLCHVRLRSGTELHAEALEADMALLDEAGQTVVEAVGLRLQRMERMQPAVQDNVSPWLYELQWQLKARPHGEQTANQLGTDQSGTWLIFVDNGGAGQALAAMLEARGATCVLVVPGEVYQITEQGLRCRINPTEPAHFHQMLRDILGAERLPCRGVVHLWSLEATPLEETTVASLATAQALGCGTALHVVQALAQAGCSQLPRLWLVTRGAQAIGPERVHVAPAQAPLWGLGRVIAQEHPELWGGLVDLDPEALPGEAAGLWDELWYPDGEDQVAFRGDQRYVARIVRSNIQAIPRKPFQVRTDGSYLITGGLGGLGLAVARWLVAQGARRLILLGRTKLEPRSTWSEINDASPSARRIAAIRELEALGASVHVAAVDVTDAAQLTSFLARYKQEGWPPIRGVVHAAGLLQDRLLLRMDPEAFDAVLQPKIVGAWLLDRLLADAPLDFFVLFSSAASLLGSFGQGNYAAGNAFLDALAHSRHARGLPALSINWGPWAEVGMAAQQDLHAQHAQRGMHAIPLKQGLQTLAWLLRHDPVQIAVMPVDWRQLHRSSPAGAEPPLLSAVYRDETSAETPTDTLSKEGSLLQDLLLADPSQRQSLLESHLQQIAARVLRLDHSRLDLRQPLHTLGMDSIMAVELKNRIEGSLGARLSLVDFLGGASLHQLAERIVSQLLDDERLAELLAEVEQLSMDEVQALLADEVQRGTGGKSDEGSSSAYCSSSS
jgi:acyl transferase domain-containing protein/acyl carrier protein